MMIIIIFNEKFVINNLWNFNFKTYYVLFNEPLNEISVVVVRTYLIIDPIT